ncbi:hypothetical protein VDIAB_270149 [Vibrio diabolicus]|nr:hypothetical protein VDIAB_270149 [Vibrio diabolicus]
MTTNQQNAVVSQPQTVVVKLGTSVLTGGTLALDRAHMVELARQCAELKKQRPFSGNGFVWCYCSRP